MAEKFPGCCVGKIILNLVPRSFLETCPLGYWGNLFTGRYLIRGTLLQICLVRVGVSSACWVLFTTERCRIQTLGKLPLLQVLRPRKYTPPWGRRSLDKPWALQEAAGAGTGAKTQFSSPGCLFWAHYWQARSARSQRKHLRGPQSFPQNRPKGWI